MNSNDPAAERVYADSADFASEEDVEGLYPGDRGMLPLDTRRVLVQLLSGPFIDGRRHSRVWPILMRDEAVIRSRLSDLFLELVIDTDQQVAFTRQAEIDDFDTPTMLRRSPLTLIDSVILLYLRHCLTRADMRGERAVVDLQEILEHASPYQQATSTDHAGFGKKIQASIQKMKANSILQKIRGGEDRYEISPILKLLFSADQIAALTRQYDALAGGESQTVIDEANDSDHPDEEALET